VSVDVVSHDVERLRAIVTRRLGLRFDEGKLGFLGEVLGRRAKDASRSVDAYLQRLDAGGETRDEWRALIEELTVGETYFLRSADQLRAFSDIVLDPFARATELRPLRILSAGCASGEEAYSLAILARERLPEARLADVSIRAVDVNPVMLEKAARAKYSQWALRETSLDVKARWFKPDGRDFALDPLVRAMVSFEERNLTVDDPLFWRPEGFDVVFCRNVLMYFEPSVAQAAVARIAGSLAPGGLFFLGSAETLRGLSHSFHLRHTHDTFYYQRRGHSDEACARTRSNDAEARALTPAPEPSTVDLEASWVENIRRASDRIEEMTSGPRSLAKSAANGRRPIGDRAPYDLGVAIDLVGRERFSEASAVLGSLPPESGRDPDVLLLRAVLSTHRGDLADAERVCAELIAIDELSAGAHYVIALCREGTGDLMGAIEHDQIANYLDPGFAMPRLHRGLLARRAGDHATARDELGQALALLGREDASRLLLFGGGFARDALVALCRAELVACGGLP
jgi:chemotaxis protein methyltransferase CheR